MSDRKGISSFSILLLSAMAAVAGLACLRMLNVQYVPSSSERTITVQCSMPSASARTVEAEVISKLEGILSGSSGCRGVISQSRQDGGSVTLSFRKGTDMAAARFDVASRIRSIYDELPKGISYPDISLDASGEVARTALSYEIRASIPSSQISEYAQEHIIPAVSRVQGVEKAELYGATPYHLVISYDEQKAGILGTSGSEIMRAFSNALANSPLGIVSYGENSMMVTLDGGGDIERIEEIPVKNIDGRVIRMGDIATWSYEESLPERYYRVNGLNTIVLNISTSSRTNILKVTSDIMEKMSELEKNFPEGMTARISYDSSEYVRSELSRILSRTALCLMILLVFVFLTSMSGLYTLMTAITIFLSLLISLAIYALSGLSIHIYTLAGISVSLGIVIDTTIVMMDHYRREHDRKVFSALVGAVMTTVFALLMIFLLPESERRNLSDFMIVIVINLAVSLMVSWFFIPAFVDTMPSWRIQHQIKPKKLRRTARWNRIYYRYIDWGVRHRWIYIILLPLVFWATFRPFYKGMDRVNFYREPERLILNINAGMPEGATVQQLNEVVKEMENYLSSFDGIQLFTTSITSYSNASIQVYFKPEEENTGFPQKLKSDVTAMAINFGGANWRISGIDNGFFNNNIVTTAKTNAIILNGYNYDALLDYAEILKNHLDKNPRISGPEIRNNSFWNQPSMEYNMSYDFEKLGAASIEPATYYSVLSSKLYQQSVGRYKYGDGITNVVLQSSNRESFDLWHVLNEPVSVDSLKVNLSSVGDIVKERSGLSIMKTDHVYEIAVAYDFIGSYELHKKVCGEAVDWMNKEILPVGYKAKSRDHTWFDQHKDKYLWLILLIALAIYVVLAITLESFLKPLSVILMIPVSFIGVFLVFGLSKITFDQGGFAALIMLCGLTVNAGIYILKERKGTLIRDYIRAFDIKAVPISLTVISTILGLIPFLSDGPTEVFWFDFAAGTIAGMALSAIAIIFVFPVFCVRKKIRGHCIEK